MTNLIWVHENARVVFLCPPSMVSICDLPRDWFVDKFVDKFLSHLKNGCKARCCGRRGA